MTDRAIKKKTTEFQGPASSADVSSGSNVVSYTQYKENNLAERIIADSNELPVNFLEQGANIQRCVARVHNADQSFGTGFLISPSIVMTNNHVLPNKETAATAKIEFILERPDDPASATFVAADADRLEGELLKLAGGVVEGRFEPAAEPHWDLCADCPGRAALCSWDEDRTLQRL